jgi:hypothetical protein
LGDLERTSRNGNENGNGKRDIGNRCRILSGGNFLAMFIGAYVHMGFGKDCFGF